MEIDEIWKESLYHIKEQVSPHTFETWFIPLVPKGYQDGVFMILVPNKFFGDRLRENFYDIIRENLMKYIPSQDLKVLFIESDGAAERKPTASRPVELDKPDRRRSLRSLNLNAKYTFSTFVVGGSNQFAHAASLKVAERPGEVYNPLFLYGGVGLGKTHLLNAIGNYVLEEHPEKKIFYISSEQFTNEVINSIRFDRMSEFRNRYRTVDMLLIDDIQFIAGKERTQEEFFHTFNTLYETNKQIVISSDRSTKEMSDVEERLRSRFEMGLIADIQPPDVETRTAIIKRKSEMEGIHLDDEVALFIASRIKTNIRELEGSLIRLGAFHTLTGKNITIDFVKEKLADILDEREKMITPDEIQQAVAERFHLKVTDLKAKKRTKTLVYPRQISMFLCRQLTELSFPEIGRHFGGKDHSTVIHAHRHITQKMESDPQTKDTVNELIKKLKMK